MAVRILIVDDHQLAREGLKAVLSADGLEIAGEAASGEEALAMTATLVPDIVLMDVRLGAGIDGLEATRRIAALGLPCRVVMLSLHDMPAYVREALAAGAAGYVLKDASVDELRGAVSQVMAGQSVVPLGLMSAALREGDRAAAQAEAVAMLTVREREVLALVAQGQRGEAGLLGVGGKLLEARSFHRPVVRMDEVEHLDALERAGFVGGKQAAAGGVGEVDAPVDAHQGGLG